MQRLKFKIFYEYPVGFRQREAVRGSSLQGFRDRFVLPLLPRGRRQKRVVPGILIPLEKDLWAREGSLGGFGSRTKNRNRTFRLRSGEGSGFTDAGLIFLCVTPLLIEFVSFAKEGSLALWGVSGLNREPVCGKKGSSPERRNRRSYHRQSEVLSLTISGRA